MKRIAVFVGMLSMLLSLIQTPVDAAAPNRDVDPGDRSDRGDVYSSGVSGADQRAIMEVGPSSTDWIGLSRSSAYWVADRDVRANGRPRSLSTAAAATDDNNWGWLGLLGLVGLWGIVNRSRLR